jgi:translation initiation factor 3 subunit I
VNPDSTLLATGGADNTLRLWEVQTGKLLHTWEFATSIKRCEFSPDGRQLLGVTEKRSGHLSTIVVYEINPDPEAKQSDEQVLRIVCDEAKATVAGFSYLAKYIISGHDDGSITQWDGKTGELLSSNFDVHEADMQGACRVSRAARQR